MVEEAHSKISMKLKDKFTHIWNDPVGSQVIASLVTASGIFLLGAMKSLFTNEEYIDSLCSILNFSLPLWLVALLVWGSISICIFVNHNRNKSEKRKLEEVIRYKNPFITFKSESTDHRYCANCWENDHRRVQLNADCFDCFECPKCHSSGNFSELEESKKPTSVLDIYNF